MFKKLSIIIPAFNEANTIQLILDKIMDVELMDGMDKEIVIVDDCSADNSISILEDYRGKRIEADIKVIHHEVNMGKGAAIRTGIKQATGDLIIIQDADLEYDPRDYNRLLKPILEGHADVVYGSRFMGGNPHRILFFWHSLGNKILTYLSNMFTNLNLTDMETCYKLFKADLVKGINLRENRFGFEPEVTAKIARIHDVQIFEVGISYYGRTYDQGKKIKAVDAFRAFWCILKYNVFKR